MDSSLTPTEPVSPVPGIRFSWWGLGLFLIVAAVLFARVRLLELPLERDEGEYAYGAQLLLHGGRLYDDLHSMKWPGLYAAYAILFWLGGETVTTIHGGLIAVNLATALGLFLLARQFLDRVSSLVAAISFLVLSALPVAHGIIANAEHFAILFPIFGLWCLVSSLRDRQWFGILIAGALIGLGPVMKQHAHAFVALGGVMALLSPRPGSGRQGRINLGQAAVYSLGVFLTWGAMCLAVWQRGDWEQFVTWTVIYPRDYTRQVSIADAPANFAISALPIFAVSWPLVLLAFCGTISVLRDRNGERLLWGVGFLVASLISLCPGFYFREHYFLMLMPSVALLCGWGFEALSRHLANRSGAPGMKLARAVCFVMLLLPLIMQSKLLFALPPDQVCRNLYGNNPFVESPHIGAFLKERMSEEDRMVIFGSEPQLCFYSQRRLATGDIYMYPLTEVHPLATSMQADMIRKVTAARPRFAIFVSTRTAWLIRPGTDPMLTNWMAEFLRDYRLVGLAKRVSFEESEYLFAPPGEILKGPQTSTSPEQPYVAVFCRRDSLSAVPQGAGIGLGTVAFDNAQQIFTPKH